MLLDRKQLERIKAANQHPLNQAAAEFLRQTDWGVSLAHLHSLSLMCWGLENGLLVDGYVLSTEPIDDLCRLEERLGPAEFTRLTAGEDEEGTEVCLTAEQLRNEESPLDAAWMLLDGFLSSWTSQT